MTNGFEEAIEFLRAESEAYKKVNPPDFITHFNYIDYLASISKNLSINYNPKISNKLIKVKSVERKVKLIKLTLDNIQQELTL